MTRQSIHLDSSITQFICANINKLQNSINQDVFIVNGEFTYGISNNLRDAIDELNPDGPKCDRALSVILETPGGIVEEVERMVEIIREHYQNVEFIVPDNAMSAGTIFCMSGDRIRMDYYSRLGPIDPQVIKNGVLVPALSYLSQHKRLIDLSKSDNLSDAEFALLANMDLAELHSFEQAKQLSIHLLKTWLSNHKFKNWSTTRSQKKNVDDAMRKTRAEEIATKLSDHEHWFSHSRGISRKTLDRDLNIQIDDLAEKPEDAETIRRLHAVSNEYLRRMGIRNAVITAEQLHC